MDQHYRNTTKRSKVNPIRLDRTKRRLDLYWPADIVKAIRHHCVEAATKPSAYVLGLVTLDLHKRGALPTAAAAKKLKAGV
jgi:hypothetical protein